MTDSLFSFPLCNFRHAQEGMEAEQKKVDKIKRRGWILKSPFYFIHFFLLSFHPLLGVPKVATRKRKIVSLSFFFSRPGPPSFIT